MNTTISKTRSKKSRQRDIEDKRQKKAPAAWSPKTILLALLFWLSGIFLIHLGGQLRHAQLLVGQQSPATIVASTDFPCIDLTQTELLRQQSVSSVPPVFKLNTSSIDSAQRALERIFEALSALHEKQPATSGTPAPVENVEEMLALLNIQIASRDLASITSAEDLTPLRQSAAASLARLAGTPVVSRDDRESRFRDLAASGLITLLAADAKPPRQLRVEDILLASEAMQQAVARATEEFALSPARRRIVMAMLRPWIVPNLTYDPITTAEHREQARLQVLPVVATIRTGTTIVEAGERITPAIQERLRSYSKRLQELETKRDAVLRAFGNAILLLVVLFIVFGILRTVHPNLLHDNAALLLLLILYLGCTGALKGLLYLSDTTNWISHALLVYLYPAGLLGLLATILLGGAAALAIGILSVCTAAIMLGYNFHVLMLGLFITVVSIRASYGIHRRTRVYRAGLITGLSAVIYAGTVYVLAQPAWQVFLQQAISGLVIGFLAAFLALLLIPLFEMLFKITTDITLLELSDMGNPLLQRLAIEAPGTYHHSLMVANLAAAAAQEIGANALAVRVGAYFHDIGKLTKPEFFIENAQHRANPHDDLSPTMSTLVVTSHVKEGLTLAERHKLPPIIREAIAEHHGNTLVSYFYHRACKQQESGSAQDGQTKSPNRVNEQDFRYPGPRPQRKEMAILALADSVEAASRSIEKTTSSRIENLVNEIVDKKIQDGQLDESDLTMRQIAQIKKSFIFTLNSMLHGRVPYPKNETSNQQSPNSPPA